MEVGSVNSKNTLDSIQNTQAQATDDDFEKKLKAAVQSGDDTELKKVCNDFENIFISMIYKQMKATVPQSDYLQSDSGTEIYNSMFDDQLCEVASERGIGLGDMMYKQLSKQYKTLESSNETTGGVVDEKK